ncbi:non-ribosomal peptide synthetase [Streptomyces sp. LZ34]
MTGQASIGQLKLAAARQPAHARFWQGRLDAGARTRVPGRPAPAAEDRSGPPRMVRYRFPDALSRRLDEESGHRPHVLYVLLAAGVAALLHLYTAAETVTIGQARALGGAPEAGPDRAGPEILMPVSCAVSGTDVLATVRRRMRTAVLETYAHQDFPLEALLEAGAMDIAGQPPFDVAIRMEHVHEAVDAKRGHAPLLLSFSRPVTSAGPAGVTGVLEAVLHYSPARFAEPAAVRLLRHLTALLDRALADPQRSLRDLDLLTDHDEALLARFNDTGASDAPRATLHELFERTAAERPDAVALLHSSGSLTYSQLDGRANALARLIAARGAGPGDRVAVLAERSSELVVGILAVLKAGAAYVPIAPSLPEERIGFMLRDSGAVLVLAGGAYRPRAHASVPVLDLRAEASLPPAAAPAPRARPDDLAYVIYTSGSTGTPKGVMVEQRSVVELLAWKQRRYPVGPGDVILQKTSITFDVSVWELFGWMSGGAALCLLDPGEERDPEAVIAAIARHRVTVAHFVPPMLGPFADYVAATRSAGRLSTLRWVFASGDELGADHVRRFRAALGASGPGLVNFYGPTEATVHVAHFVCDDIPGPVPIGRPVGGTRLHVLDDRMRPRTLGVPGELCVAGNSLARGYLGRPELTGERFPDDPFPGESRVYRTGDLCRWLDDGTLEFLGRMDHQVKIRGYRIDPGEVEHRLRGCPGVRDALVVASAGPSEGRRLLGYVTGSDALDPADLARRLRRVLPAYMVPSVILRLDAFPLSASGKVDRHLLPVPVPAGRGRTDGS